MLIASLMGVVGQGVERTEPHTRQPSGLLLVQGSPGTPGSAEEPYEVTGIQTRIMTVVVICKVGDLSSAQPFWPQS